MIYSAERAYFCCIGLTRDIATVFLPTAIEQTYYSTSLNVVIINRLRFREICQRWMTISRCCLPSKHQQYNEQSLDSWLITWSCWEAANGTVWTGHSLVGRCVCLWMILETHRQHLVKLCQPCTAAIFSYGLFLAAVHLQSGLEHTKQMLSWTKAKLTWLIKNILMISSKNLIDLSVT